MSDLTSILVGLEQGDPHAADQLLPLVYHELRQLAAQHLAQEAPGQTLQATALVHEAYLRLVGGSQKEISWNGRGHFFAAAAQAMRRILVEAAAARSDRSAAARDDGRSWAMSPPLRRMTSCWLWTKRSPSWRRKILSPHEWSSCITSPVWDMKRSPPPYSLRSIGCGKNGPTPAPGFRTPSIPPEWLPFSRQAEAKTAH
jgi:hypothetical protein